MNQNNNNSNNNINRTFDNIRRSSYQQRELVLSLPRQLYDKAVASAHRPSFSAEFFAMRNDTDDVDHHHSANININNTNDVNNSNICNMENTINNTIDHHNNYSNTHSSSNANICTQERDTLDYIHKCSRDSSHSSSEESPNQPMERRIWRERESSQAVTREFETKLREVFRENQRLRRTRQLQHLTLGKGLGSCAEATLQDGRYVPHHVLSTMINNEQDLCKELLLSSRRPLPSLSQQEEEKEEEEQYLIKQKLESGQSICLPPIREAITSLSAQNNSAEFSNTHKEKTVTVQKEDSRLPLDLLKESNNNNNNVMHEQSALFFSFPFMRHIRCREQAADCISGIVPEVEDNLRFIEDELRKQSSPYSFQEIVESVSVALRSLERGHLHETVYLPVYQLRSSRLESFASHDGRHTETSASLKAEEENLESEQRQEELQENEQEDEKSDEHVHEAMEQNNKKTSLSQIHGALEVMDYVQELLLPTVYKLLPTAHAVRWVLEYTITFLRFTVARTEAEAANRANLLARCVRCIGTIEELSANVLSLESTIEEYEAFDALECNAEQHLNGLLDRVERALRAILLLPFPLRRTRLELIEAGLHKKLQRVLLFLHEIDRNWNPTVHYHTVWKRHFLSDMFERIHSTIIPLFLTCTLGFVDETLYSKTNYLVGHARHRSNSNLLHRSLVPRACQVEVERVNEHFSYAQIGMSTKSIPSYVLGLQLCLSARYVVRQATREFDTAWGFVMHEKTDITPPAVAEKLVSHVLRKVQHKLTSKAATTENDDVSNQPYNVKETDDVALDNETEQMRTNHTISQKDNTVLSSDCASTTFLTQGNVNDGAQVNDVNY